MENELLWSFLQAAGRRYKHQNKYSISKMCEFFEVSRSGYYGFLKQMYKPDKDEDLSELILKCQEQTKSTYGYRRVKLWIQRETGTNINHKAVLSVMNKYGLLSQIRRKRKYKYYSRYLNRYDNLLGRNFSSKRPNEKWVTDISYIHTKQGVATVWIIPRLKTSSEF